MTPQIEEIKREIIRLEANAKGDCIKCKLLRAEVARLEYLEQLRRKRAPEVGQ